MRTYEYTISPDAAAKDGLVSIASLCGYIVNAAFRTMLEEGYPGCALSRCSFEIDERSKEGDSINILVDSGLNNIVTLLNRNVSITDSEGHEIGRGKIEWLMPDSSKRSLITENPSRTARRFISKFKSALPDIDELIGLQYRIDMDFKGEPSATDNFSVAFKKICDSSFFFLARSGGNTLCRAMFQTA